jgi:hypothetical protein
VHQWDKVAHPDRPETFHGSDRPRRRRVAAGTPARLRLINTQSRPSALAVTGTPYRVVSIDGIDLRGPGVKPICGRAEATACLDGSHPKAVERCNEPPSSLVGIANSTRSTDERNVR